MPPKKGAQKKKKAAVVKPLEPDTVSEYVEEDTYVEEIAMEMLELIVSRGAHVLMSHFVETLAKEQTSKDSVLDCVSAVEWQMIPHDIGEKDAADVDTNASVIGDNRSLVSVMSMPEDPGPGVQLSMRQVWMCEKEPNPCEIDRFARGMVKVKTKQKNRLQEFMNSQGKDFQLGVDQASTFYAPSVKTAGSISGGDDRSARSLHSSITRGGARSKIGKKKADTIPEIKEPYAIEVLRTQDQIENERLREAELRKMEKKKRALAKAKKQNQQEAEDKARYDKLKSELKGKNYTFDAKGNVILIKQVNGDKMPEFSASPKIDVSDSESDNEGPSGVDKKDGKKSGKDKKGTAANGKTKSDKSNPKEKNRGVKTEVPVNTIKRGPKIKVQHFTDSSTAAGPATEFSLTKGVTLRKGNVITKSKPTGKDPKNMTRTEYNQFLNEKNGTIGGTRKNSVIQQDNDDLDTMNDSRNDTDRGDRGEKDKNPDYSEPPSSRNKETRPESAPEPQKEEDERSARTPGQRDRSKASTNNKKSPTRRLQANNFLKPMRRKSEEEAVALRRSNEAFDAHIMDDPEWGVSSQGGGFTQTKTKIPVPPSNHPKRSRPIQHTHTNRKPQSASSSDSSSVPLPHLPSIDTFGEKGANGYRKDWGRDKLATEIEKTEQHALYFGAARNKKKSVR